MPEMGKDHCDVKGWVGARRQGEDGTMREGQEVITCSSNK